MEDKTAITIKKMELAWAEALSQAIKNPRINYMETLLENFGRLYAGISAVVDDVEEEGESQVDTPRA